MIRNYEWVDYIFVQSTAWYLNHDIIIPTTTSTEEHPYITISGNLSNENIGCQGTELTIGSKSGVHYQSLLPSEINVSKQGRKSSSPEDTIKLTPDGTTIPGRIGDLDWNTKEEMKNMQGVDLDSRKEFPDLMTPEGKMQVQSRISSSRKEMQRPKGTSDFIEQPSDKNSESKHHQKREKKYKKG